MGKYTIQQGDTLSEIAAKYGTTVSELASLNGIADVNKIQAGATLTLPGSGSATGASGYTYNPFQYASFTESDATKGIADKKTTAENALAGLGDYSWAKQEEYNTLLSDYQNRKDFSYDFNADALYQQYKDKYIQQGKMAMADTMGQAAAMTGGYGNSYAATAGNQAYQAQLQNLNDVIPQLYQMAYDRYNQKGQDMLNSISLLGNERNFDYGAWTDKYNRYAADRNYYSTEYDNAWNRDYGMYSADRDLAHSEHTTSEGYRYQTGRDAIADEQWEKSYELQKKNNLTSSGSDDSDDYYEDQPQPVVDPAKMEKETEDFRNNLSPASVHDAIARQMYGPYTAYVAVQIAQDKTLSDDAKMYLITKYGITNSDIQYARDKGHDI